MEEQTVLDDVWILIQVIDASRVEGASSTDDSVNLVALLKKQLSQV